MNNIIGFVSVSVLEAACFKTVKRPHKEGGVWIMFDRTAVMKGQRSGSVFLSDLLPHLWGIIETQCKSDPGERVCESAVSQHSGGSYKYCFVWKQPVLGVMVELAFYPAVALIYFFGVLKASQDDRVELNDGASMNVFCLFVLAQPLCLVLGGYTGMATYLLTALVSYNFLPWRKTKRPAKGKESKKTKKEEWTQTEFWQKFIDGCKYMSNPFT